MTVDRDGYGPRPHQTDIDRLLEDTRTLSASSIERIARAWLEGAAVGWSDDLGQRREGHATALHAAWVEAERAALHALESKQRTPEWDSLRKELLDLTEHHDALISWRQEHGEAGHRAEDALLGAGLALLARPDLGAQHLHTLLAPMSETLPWLREVARPGART
ncbi:MAG TPA: hypothetical protein VEK76_08590 [Candidatus Binatia bacterium]|nr:hypothetical protein [Candidatus Binatia bacterium]